MEQESVKAKFEEWHYAHPNASQYDAYQAGRQEMQQRVNNAEGMAGCMDMLRKDLIAAGVIPDGTAPMFMTEAVLGAIQKSSNECEKWRGIASAKFGDGRTVQEIESAARLAGMEEMREKAAEYVGAVHGGAIASGIRAIEVK